MKKLYLLIPCGFFVHLSAGAQTSINATISVTQDPVLAADAGADQNIVPGTAISIGATAAATGGSGTYTYNWSPGADLDDSTIANPSYTMGSSDITFSLDVVDSKNCTTSDDVTVTVNTVSVSEFEQVRFLIYPNPANSVLQIEGIDDLEGMQVEILDINGKKVSAKLLQNGSNKIDVSDLSTGTYLLNLKSDYDQFQTKIIIE